MELDSKAYSKGNDEGPVEGNKERKSRLLGGDLKESDSSPEASRQLCKTSRMIPLSFCPPDVIILGTRRTNHANKLTGDSFEITPPNFSFPNSIWQNNGY